MTLTNCYITLEELHLRLGGRVPPEQNVLLETAITSACRAIDQFCGQQFFDAGSASARVYRPRSGTRLKVDPFSTTTGLIVKTDSGDDGTFATTWAAGDYELDVAGGDFGQAFSAPYDTIYAVGSYLFPTTNTRRRSVQVTARWGWASVPQPVAEAARIVAEDLYKRKDAPFGVVTGSVDFGGLRIGRDIMASVSSTLAPFVRSDRTVGVA